MGGGTVLDRSSMAGMVGVWEKYDEGTLGALEHDVACHWPKYKDNADDFYKASDFEAAKSEISNYLSGLKDE